VNIKIHTLILDSNKIKKVENLEKIRDLKIL